MLLPLCLWRVQLKCPWSFSIIIRPRSNPKTESLNIFLNQSLPFSQVQDQHVYTQERKDLLTMCTTSRQLPIFSMAPPNQTKIQCSLMNAYSVATPLQPLPPKSLPATVKDLLVLFIKCGLVSFYCFHDARFHCLVS